MKKSLCKRTVVVLIILTLALVDTPGQKQSDSTIPKAVISNEEKKTEQLLKELNKKQAAIVKGLDKLEEKEAKLIKQKIKYIKETIHDTVFVEIPCPDAPLKRAIAPIKIVVISVKDTTRLNFFQRLFKTKKK